MKKIDDSKLYLYFGLVTLVIGILLGINFLYSALSVEKKVRELLASKDNVSQNFKKAYILLRDPQIFARHEYFDTEQDLHSAYKSAIELKLEKKEDLDKIIGSTYPGRTVREALRYFDNKVYYGKEITSDEKRYLEVLLDRRYKGARLGRNTMIFILLLSAVSACLFFVERKIS